MNRIAKFLIAGTLAIGFAAGGFASASGSAPDPSSSEAPGHQFTAPINPQIQAQGIITQNGFVPLTPCRVADTRNPATEKMDANSVRAFVVGGNVGFESQGGRPGGCAVPTTAAAAVLSFTTTNSTSNGYLVGWPYGQAKPTATSTTAQKGVTVTTESTQRLGSSAKISVFTAGSTDLIVDVVGYYREPIAARVASDGQLLDHSGHVTSAKRLGLGTYLVTFNVNTVDCIGEASGNYSANNVSVNMQANSALVIVRDLVTSGTPYSDGGFDLTVTC